MRDFATTDPCTAGRSATVGSSVIYVTSGVGTLLYKYGTSDTEWCALPDAEAAPPTTVNPSGTGIAAAVGSVVLFVPGSGPAVRMLKCGTGNTDWWSPCP